jgi:hypothetical protein
MFGPVPESSGSSPLESKRLDQRKAATRGVDFFWKHSAPNQSPVCTLGRAGPNVRGI